MIPVNEEVFNYLVDRFGIDDINTQCNSLLPCKQCLIENQLLNQRRYLEKNEFRKCFENTKHIKETQMNYNVYALSVNWYKEWEIFVQGKTKGNISLTLSLVLIKIN